MKVSVYIACGWYRAIRDRNGRVRRLCEFGSSFSPWAIATRLLPQLATFIYLPHLPAFHVQGSSPATIPAIRIDAHKMSDVENLAILLRSVADDCDLARVVWAWNVIPNSLPKERCVIVIFERAIWVVGCADENVTDRKLGPLFCFWH